MSIEIDWELTDAPAGDDEAGFANRPPGRPPSPGGPAPSGSPPPVNERTPRGPVRRWLLAVPLLLLLAAALGLNYVTRLGWQRISDEVIALVRYEEQLSYQGDTLMVLRLQDYSNAQWLAVRENQVAAHQPAPLPVPVLLPDTTSAEIGPLELIDTDWVRAEVVRQYQTPDGQTVTFTLPQFYRRQGLSEDWVRTAVPDTHWGAWKDWQSPHLFVRHSERDQAFVTRIGPGLEALLSEACMVWGETCDELPPAKLFLSGFVGSLEYDPLANIRVRVEFGEEAGTGALPADYFLSVPSPQLAGAPADPATEQYLTEYLAVRLIASLADTATRTTWEAAALTTEAVTHLGLHSADPGFAQGAFPPRGEDGLMSLFSLELDTPAASAATSAPLDAPAAGATLVTRLKPTVTLVTYEVQPGDTLLSIAASFAVPVETVARLNGIQNPDLIQAGTLLLIPPGGSE
jgi:LysM repeat protein